MTIQVLSVPLAAASRPLVAVRDEVAPGQTIAWTRTLGRPRSVPLAARLRRPAGEVGALVLPIPGAVVAVGEPLARAQPGQEVPSPSDAIYLGLSRGDGAALIAPLGEEVPVVSEVRGRVAAVSRSAIDIEVRAAVVHGADGWGEPVHGELVVSVASPGDELRPALIDAGKRGKILVGGSRASPEALTRARAMGVAGIVLGGAFDKELRDFAAVQQRGREGDASGAAIGLLLLQGYGKIPIEPRLFAWLRRHEGREASLMGADRTLYVYDGDEPPTRRWPPRAGDRVVALRRPGQGLTGRLARVVEELRAVPSGVAVRTATIELDDGRQVAIPLANLEAVDDAPPPAAR